MTIMFVYTNESDDSQTFHFLIFITMAKLKNTCSSTTEIVVNSILSGKNINATRVAEVLTSLGLDLEKILRASLYFTGEIEKPIPENEVIDEKGRKLTLVDYDFLGNRVRYTYMFETTRWFHTEKEADDWFADEKRYAYASAGSKSDNYQFPATAMVKDSNDMSFDTWLRLPSAVEHDKFMEKQ
jgi:hypothetical protein